MVKQKDTVEKLYKDIQDRNFSFALTLVYFVLSFGITFYLTFIYLFKTTNYFIPRFAFVVIISSFAYYFMVKHFLKFLNKTEIGEVYDFFNNTSVILTIAVFILNTIMMFLILIAIIYLIFTLVYGILSGQFTFLHNFV